MMILRRLLFSLYVGGVTYLIVTFTLGSTGLKAYRDLTEQKGLLEKNIEKIQEQADRLQGRISALQSNPERIRLEARIYHLVQPNESFVRIRDRETPGEPLSPGSILRISSATAYRPEPLLRAFALCVSLVVFLTLGLKRSNRR